MSITKLKCKISNVAVIRTKKGGYGRLYEFKFASTDEASLFTEASYMKSGQFYTKEKLPVDTLVEFHLSEGSITSFRPERGDEVEALNSEHYIRETARILALKKAGAFAASEEDVM